MRAARVSIAQSVKAIREFEERARSADHQSAWPPKGTSTANSPPRRLTLKGKCVTARAALRDRVPEVEHRMHVLERAGASQLDDCNLDANLEQLSAAIDPRYQDPTRGYKTRRRIWHPPANCVTEELGGVGSRYRWVAEVVLGLIYIFATAKPISIRRLSVVFVLVLISATLALHVLQVGSSQARRC